MIPLMEIIILKAVNAAVKAGKDKIKFKYFHTFEC